MHSKAALAVALAALVLVAPGAAPPAAAAGTVATTGDLVPAAAAVDPKVVIVVGPMEGMTDGNRKRGDAIAAEALKYTSNVVKVYSPNATWGKVKAAAQGASILVYIGHGNGWPNPYTSSLLTDRYDGFGLNVKNAAGTYDDSTKKYYGEACIDGAKPDPSRCPNNGNGIRLAPNAIVILNSLCYAPGAGEPGMADPSVAVAKQRVDNFASGFIRAGARAVLADDYGSAQTMVDLVFTTHQSIVDAWRALPPYTWSSRDRHEIPWTPTRNPAFLSIMDPETWTTGFTRVITTDVALTTDDVVAGAAAAASPADPSAGPQLLATTGPEAVSPNFDGRFDHLDLWHRLSEVASWTAQVLGPDGDVIRSQSGSSEFAAPSWDGMVDGNPAPPGTYHWTLHATDGSGNPPLDAEGDVAVVDESIPTTAVLAFTPLSGTKTNDKTLAFKLTFASAVTGLTAGDFSRAGTATSCTTNGPTGDGTDWSVTVSGCTAGTVALTLKANSVLDGSFVVGPPTAVAAPTVLIDRTKPAASAPKTTFRTGAALAGSTMGIKVAWGASDKGGAGLASYDLARSVDGGAFKLVKSGLTSKSVYLTVASGHTYRYEVRARDRAGNIGSWAAGPTLRPALVQQTSGALTWGGSWATLSDAAYSGGSARTATNAGKSVLFKFSGRAVAVVMSKDPAYGQVKVYLDGSYVTTIDTVAASHADRQVVFARSFAWGSHKLKLVVVGTSGRPKVVVDAFEVIR